MLETPRHATVRSERQRQEGSAHSLQHGRAGRMALRVEQLPRSRLARLQRLALLSACFAQLVR